MSKPITIETSSFGLIVIDGRQYTSDLVIYPDGRIEDGWWRRSSHRLSMEDIDKLVVSGPDVIVVGTGVNGLMIPEPELNKMLAKKGIEVIALPNPKAIELFNGLSSKKRAGACFHLTC